MNLSSKRIKITFCWLIFSFLILSALKPVLTQAQPETLDILRNVARQAGYEEPRDPILVVVRIVNHLLTFIGVLFVLMIIYGGLMWMTGGATDFLWLAGPGKDQPGKIQKAKQVLRDAIIGLAIIMLAKVIYYFIIERMEEVGRPPSG